MRPFASGIDLPITNTAPPGAGDSHASHRHLPHYDDNGLADYIAHAKYTRYRDDLGRWENFAEAVGRVENMHREFFRDRLATRIGSEVAATAADPADHGLLIEALGDVTLEHAVVRAFAAVKAKHVLPSMRSLQFGGEAILRNHARLFNCAFSPVDRIAFFREYFFLLLSGVGCGFSVQRHHVERLPEIPAWLDEAALPKREHVVADSIEGWADALDFLLRGCLEGFVPRFDYAQVRPAGRRLLTARGVAPGPEPLRRALADVGAILRAAAGRRLRAIEILDLCMFVARAVMGGGARRSASICLFSADDAEMTRAKTGNWLAENPQRAACNISAVFSPATADEAEFRRTFDTQKEFGEPGFYFSSHPDYGCNPCGEAGLHPVLTESIEETPALPSVRAGTARRLVPCLSGWELCNLTTINGGATRRPDDFLAACVHAAVLGTLQAAYTHIPYLGRVSRAINERDALLGVSICGFMDNPGILFAPRILERGARICRAANQLVAAALGIRPAARVTCVKPEGTASLLLDAAPGIHPRPARRYFRYVQANRLDPVYRRFRTANERMTEPSRDRPATDDVIVFPVEAPAHAIVRHQVGAVEFLRLVLLVQKYWVLAGEAAASRSPGLHHSVSNTCAVRSHEWSSVADFIWRHRSEFKGVTLFGDDAPGRYPQVPFRPVVTNEDAQRWTQLHYRPVDYTGSAISEAGGEDVASDTCIAGACEGRNGSNP